MRYATVLPLVAASACAIVIPDDAVAQELVLEQQMPTNILDVAQESGHESSSWWEEMLRFSRGDLRTSVEDIWSDGIDNLDSSLGSFSESVNKEMDMELPSLSDFLPSWARPGHGGRRPGHHGPSNVTLYQAIHLSKYTTKIAKLVDEFPDIVTALNCTGTNLTMFVPTDRAFERIPHHGKDGKKPPRELMEKVLKYHVVPGLYPAGRILARQSLPTLVKEEKLGGRPQRLKVSVGLFGMRINFYSKVVVANIFLANGIAHGVDHLLIPPTTSVGHLIDLFPSKFSTLTLAVLKTGISKELYNMKTTGLTFFAPTNEAFKKLGPAANAFLFNTEKGLGYLGALLKYHISVNETFYSDAFYGPGHGSDRVNTDAAQYHIDLPTLLDDKSLSIDVARWAGFVAVKVNGFVRVAVQNVVARDGVVQVVNSVLIPPHKRQGAYLDGDEIEVEELVERFEPYVGSGKDFALGEL